MASEAVIFGAGGFALEVYALVRDMGIRVRGFIAPRLTDETQLPAPWLGNDEKTAGLVREGVDCAFLAIGEAHIREKVFKIAIGAGLCCPSLVHPKAVWLSETPPGDGTIVYPGALVMAGCCIGQGVLLNAGCTLGHEVVIRDFANINPGAHLAGRVRVGAFSLVGIGSAVSENISIGSGSVIGAGCVVIRNVDAGAKVYGVPAHRKTNS